MSESDGSSYSMLAAKNQRRCDVNYGKQLGAYWDHSIGSTLDKLRAFTKYVPFTEFPKFLAKYEIFKKILGIHGGIIECGVHQGGGLMTWGILSSIFEPVNHRRKVIGFDSFEGFTEICPEDLSADNKDARVGGLAVNAFADIQEAVDIFDSVRPLGHINKITVVKGDANTTIEKYVSDNPHLVVALLYLDFDVYKPTKTAIELLRSRMPIGSVIVFDELYHEDWPGETQAVIDTLGIPNLKLERFPFHPQLSFAVLG